MCPRIVRSTHFSLSLLLLVLSCGLLRAAPGLPFYAAPLPLKALAAVTPCDTTNTAAGSNPTYTIILHSDVGLYNTNELPISNLENAYAWINQPVVDCDTMNLTNMNPGGGGSPFKAGPIYHSTGGPNNQPYCSYDWGNTPNAGWGTKQSDSGLRRNEFIPFSLYYVFKPYRGAESPDFGQMFFNMFGSVGEQFSIDQGGGPSDSGFNDQLEVRFLENSRQIYVTNMTTNWYLFVVCATSNALTIRTNRINAFTDTNTPCLGEGVIWSEVGHYPAFNYKSKQDIAAFEVYPTYDYGTVALTNRENALRTKYALP